MIGVSGLEVGVAFSGIGIDAPAHASIASDFGEGGAVHTAFTPVPTQKPVAITELVPTSPLGEDGAGAEIAASGVTCPG